MNALLMFRGLIFIAVFILFILSSSAQSWTIVSPDGNIRSVVKYDEGSDSESLIYYTEVFSGGVWYKMVDESPLGVKIDDREFVKSLSFVSATEQKLFQQTYEMPHGKKRLRSVQWKELTLTFKNPQNKKVDLIMRVFNDGVAFKYRIADTDSKPHKLERELTGFAIPKGARLWMHPNDKVTMYSPAYETYYVNGVSINTKSPTGNGWAFPVLFNVSGLLWGLITEAAVQPNFYGSRLYNSATNDVFYIRGPEPDEGNNTGELNPVFTLPLEMPWRVIILGEGLAQIVESTLVEDLNPPSIVKNTDWIKPGRAAWSWWSDPTSPQDAKKQMKFIDFAADMGWQYLLVDANWTIMDNGNIHDVLRYAKKKGIGVWLWYNSGGPHNLVTEKPRDCLTYPELRRYEFNLLNRWGVKGVKVDFFQSDKQNVISLYHQILKDAADFKILVNFHGCTLPRGWSRTYPHLLSMEAVKGEEWYMIDEKFPELAPIQNTITPFTRNVVGPMDYTPVGFSNQKYPHKTTYAHELALSVVFESGIIHFADKPEAYLNLPKPVKDFLKILPAAWDDTKFVEGYPGKYVVIARRNGDRWFVAGINGTAEKIEKSLILKFLKSGKNFKCQFINDNSTGTGFYCERFEFNPTAPLNVSLLPYGGFVGIFE
ncbi:MAG: glycoside hydrolase family 97 catalytic domain-containing protein [Verrucomicrobiia bacterium]